MVSTGTMEQQTPYPTLADNAFYMGQVQMVKMYGSMDDIPYAALNGLADALDMESDY